MYSDEQIIWTDFLLKKAKLLENGDLNQTQFLSRAMNSVTQKINVSTVEAPNLTSISKRWSNAFMTPIV